MNKRFALYALISLALFAPSLAGAQSYFDHDWYRAPTVTPTSSPNIIFPVQGGAIFYDDFGDARSGGRLHEGNDLMAPKMTPILAAQGGRIVSAATLEPTYGYMISIAGDDGYKYNYLHINNDTPGTDDNLGGASYAYASGIQNGVQVTQGQHIAWVGDSGNAESAGSHLHFEIRLPDDTAINPYSYLKIALGLYAYDVAAVIAASPDINTDKGLIENPALISYCTPGSLVRTPLVSAVYYCGSDGRRYVFPNSQTYATWYSDFSTVKTISLDDISKIALGGNVTYRPGIKLVKIQSDEKVYAVDHNGTLRSIVTPAIAVKYYGANWSKQVEDIPESFFVNYKMGASINY